MLIQKKSIIINSVTEILHINVTQCHLILMKHLNSFLRMTILIYSILNLGYCNARTSIRVARDNTRIAIRGVKDNTRSSIGGTRDNARSSIGGARDYARSSITVAGDGASLLGSNLQQLKVRIGCMVFVYYEFKAHFNPDIQQTLANQFLHYIVIILGLFA